MLVIVGPTASGKSAVALEIAERIGGRVLSLDSMQVYRGMDIGTAKASADDQTRVPHHMIDLVDGDRILLMDETVLATVPRAMHDLSAQFNGRSRTHRLCL